MSFIIGALENGLHINSSNLSISYSCYIPRSIVSLTKSHSMAALGEQQIAFETRTLTTV